MLPNQRYVRLSNPKGDITIARKVLTTIVYREVRDMPGVVELGGNSVLKRLFRWLGLNVGMRGVRVDLGEGEIGVVVTVVIRYGVDIPELARALRQRIQGAVHAMTGLEVGVVDVHVASIRTERPWERPVEEDASAAAARRFGFDEPATMLPPASESGF